VWEVRVRGQRDPVRLITTAAHAAGWLSRTGWRVTRALPGGAQAQRQMLRLETALLDGLHGEGAVVRNVRARLTSPVTLVLPGDGRPEPLRAAMADLLNRSVTTDADAAAAHLYATILRQLVPDEARIVAALADGPLRPAIDVVRRGPLGNGGHVVLRNASTVGRAAGVSSPDHVPLYVTRLHSFGIVGIAPEDDALGEQYDILLTDQAVRAANTRGTRIVRHTVLLSELGRRFWQATDPTAP
jgi:hypothetical protein